MSKLTKKFVAIATALTVSVMLVGPGTAQGATIEELNALIASLSAQLASLTAQLAALQGGGTGTVSGCTITSFDRDLSQGMEGADVKCLQIILNSDVDTRLAASGVGSSGSETTYFGPLTKAAVVKLQNKNAATILTPIGLTAGTGYVGPATRPVLNSMIGTGGTVPGPVPTSNTVSLSTDTPGASAVAAGAQDVPFTNVTFTAGSQAYTVTAIAVLRGGISLNSNITNVKLYDGAVQVGSTQALNSVTNKATFSNLNWIIPAYTAKTLIIKGSIASGAGAGNSIVLGIAAATDITASAAFSATFPINGNARTVATQAVGSTTVDVLTTPADSLPNSGSVEQHVATVRLTTSATEGFNINSLKITNVGTAGNADISNIKIKYGATLLGTVASLTNGAATFTGNPLINVPINTSKQLDVYVDIAAGINTGRTIRFEVTQALDVVAIGQNSGGQITVLPAATFPEQAAAQTISQGALTIALDAATNPSAQTYVIGTNNRAFNAIKFSAGATEGVRVTQITLTLGGTASASDISNVALYDGATLIAGPSGISGSTVQFGVNTVNAFDATGLFDIARSTNKVITVKADISSGASSSAAGTLSLTAANTKADGLTSQNDVPTASITGSATGNSMTIGAYGSLAVALDPSSPAAQTVAKGGSTEVVLARYSLSAGTGEDIAVSTLIIRLYRDTANASTSSSGDVTNVSIWDDTTQLGTTVAAPAGSATFNANLIVPAGTKKIVTVKAIIPSGSVAGAMVADLEAGTAGDIVSSGVNSLASLTETGDAAGNLMTIGTPTLAVNTASVPIASSKVVNTPGVTITTLLLTAGTAEGVTVNSIRVSFDDAATLDGASAANSRLSNVKLMDGVTQVGTTMQITDGTPDYSQWTGLSLPILAGQQKALSVVVDVGSATDTFYCGAATTGSVTGAGTVSGTSVTSTGELKVGTLLTITTGGTLTIAVSADTPVAANIKVGATEGASNVSYSKIKFSGGTENVKISRLAVTRSGGSDNNFGAIKLYTGTDTLVGTTYLASGVATFNFNPGSELIVPAAGDLYVTVKADVMGMSTGATDATSSTFYLASATTSVDSIGVSSQTAITESTTTPDVAAASNFGAMALYKTTASVSLAGPTAGGSVAAALQEVLRVAITNNGLYDLTVTKVNVTPYFTGTVGTTTVDATRVALYWSTDLATAITSTTSAATITPMLQNGTALLLQPISNNTVAAGTTKTLVVKAYTIGMGDSTTVDSFHMDLAAVADFGWTPAGGAQVITLTPGMPIQGPTLQY
ncbi:MAG: hypothetical protein ABIG40_01505 [Parcubacteria group bacterium]